MTLLTVELRIAELPVIVDSDPQSHTCVLCDVG